MRKRFMTLLLAGTVAAGGTAAPALADDNDYYYFSLSVNVPHEQHFLLNRSALHDRLADVGMEVLKVDSYNTALIARSTSRQPGSSSLGRAFEDTAATLGGIQRIPKPDFLRED